MKVRLVLERTVLVLSVFVLAGTNRCREDYFFATQARVSLTGTVDLTRTVTPSGTVIDTPEATDTPTPETTEIPTVVSTVTATPEPTVALTVASALPASLNAAETKARAQIGGSGILSELATLDKPENSPTNKSSNKGSQSTNAAPSVNGASGNWLGSLYDKSNNSEDKENADASGVKQYAGQDSDGDGYSDKLEEAERTDPNASKSFPSWIKSTDLSARLRGNDNDGDGVSNKEEQLQGTDAYKADTDGDSVADGAERLSGSNPLDVKSVPLDSDGDGLSDDYEKAAGTNLYSRDTDNDGLSDALEAALGTNPIARDSDLDGISDGAEVKANSDPLIPDIR